MPQALSLDPRWRGVYLALAVLGPVFAGCAARLPSIAPAGLTPVPTDSARAWAVAFVPERPIRYDLTWRYTTQQGSSAGRAAVRFAPPDTLRFDYRGPFGRSGSALVVGDVVVWAEPPDDVASLVSTARLFRAALAIPDPPPDGVRIAGRRWDGRLAWRYALGTEAFDYVVDSAPPTLSAELRRAGEIVGQSVTDLRPGGRHPAAASVRFPQEAALFTFTVEAVDSSATFAPDTWHR